MLITFGWAVIGLLPPLGPLPGSLCWSPHQVSADPGQGKDLQQERKQSRLQEFLVIHIYCGALLQSLGQQVVEGEPYFIPKFHEIHRSNPPSRLLLCVEVSPFLFLIEALDGWERGLSERLRTAKMSTDTYKTLFVDINRNSTWLLQRTVNMSAHANAC